LTSLEDQRVSLPSGVWMFMLSRSGGRSDSRRTDEEEWTTGTPSRNGDGTTLR
jgi:hypothetical protein